MVILEQNFALASRPIQVCFGGIGGECILLNVNLDIYIEAYWQEKMPSLLYYITDEKWIVFVF